MFLTQEEVLYLKNIQGSLQSRMPGSVPTVKHGRFYDGFDSNVVVQHSVAPIITFHGPITVREYGDRLVSQVQPMIQTLFPKNDAVFQDNDAPIHTAETVQSWFEEHEDELQHLPWPAQSQHLYNIEPIRSGLETRVRNRFPPPTSLKQLEEVIQEEWYKIPLETVQNLCKSIPRRTAAILKANVVQHHINKELCTVSVVSISIILSNPCTYKHTHM
jgi:hypothetical protein